MLKQIELLTKLNAISGYEQNIIDFILNDVKNDNLIIKNDKIGSLILQQANEVDVLINTHVDESGFIITEINKEGLVSLQPVGSNIQPTNGELLTVVTESGEELNGIVITKGEKTYLDLGFKGNQKVSYQVGNMVVYKDNLNTINNNLFNKGLDNRIGVALNLELVKERVNNISLASAFSSLSYLNHRGSRTSSFITNPKLVINIDLVDQDLVGNIKLGDGPVLVILDSGVILNQKVKDYVISTAKENDINLQLLASNKVKFDTLTVQQVRDGIITLSIAIPAKFIGGRQLVGKDDIKKTYELLKKLITNLDDKKLVDFKTFWSKKGKILYTRILPFIFLKY